MNHWMQNNFIRLEWVCIFNENGITSFKEVVSSTRTSPANTASLNKFLTRSRNDKSIGAGIIGFLMMKSNFLLFELESGLLNNLWNQKLKPIYSFHLQWCDERKIKNQISSCINWLKVITVSWYHFTENDSCLDCSSNFFILIITYQN